MVEKTFTIAGAAKELRMMAEATSKMSKNWDNYESICVTMLEACWKAGVDRGFEDASEDLGR